MKWPIIIIKHHEEDWRSGYYDSFVEVEPKSNVVHTLYGFGKKLLCWLCISVVSSNKGVRKKRWLWSHLYFLRYWKVADRLSKSCFPWLQYQFFIFTRGMSGTPPRHPPLLKSGWRPPLTLPMHAPMPYPYPGHHPGPLHLYVQNLKLVFLKNTIATKFTVFPYA